MIEKVLARVSPLPWTLLSMRPGMFGTDSYDFPIDFNLSTRGVSNLDGGCETT